MTFRGLFHRVFGNRLLGLGIIALLLTAALTGFVAPGASGFMQDSPPPTATPVPPAATATPQPTNTPSGPPAATTTPAATATDSGKTPQTATPTTTPQPTASPTPTPQLAPAQLTPPAIAPPTPAASGVITDTDPPSANENLVKLIDTFVLYSSYFLLGLGVIIFLVVLVFLYLLHRRSQAIHKQEPPPEP